METQDKKLSCVCTYAQKYGLHVLGAGDIYDTWMCGHDVVNSTLHFLRTVMFRSCYGQHELPNHDINELWRSPLKTHMVTPVSDNFAVEGMYIHVDVASWGREPEHNTSVFPKNIIRVLLIHKTVYLGEKPFPNATGDVRKLIKEPQYAQYDVIISGDNHIAFTLRHGKTLWVNCGCLYRTDASEREYVPSFWLFAYSTQKKRIVAIRKEVPYVRKHVTREHLEVKHKEKEWDSDFAKSIKRVKGARPSSFIEDIETAVVDRKKSVKKRVFDFIGV